MAFAIRLAVTLTSNNYLSFWIGAQDPHWPSEHYATYITGVALAEENLGACEVKVAEQDDPNGESAALSADGYVLA